MKKTTFSLLVLVLTIVAVLFVACGPEEVSKVTGITISRHEMTMAEIDSVRLSYEIQPQGVDAEVTWASSNPEVATVDRRGYVRTLKPGTTNITVSCEGYSDACLLTVKTYLETLSFTGASLVGEPDTTAFDGKPHQAKMNGQTVYVYKSLMTLQIMTEGLYVDENGYLNGSPRGAIITMKTPVWFGPRELNNGKLVREICTNYTITSSYDGSVMYTAPAGVVDEPAYLTAFGNYCAAVNDHDELLMTRCMSQAAQAVSGTTLSLVAYHTREEGYGQDDYVLNDMPEAVVLSGSFKLSEGGVTNHMFAVSNLNLTVRPLDKSAYFWGVNVQHTTETDYHLADQQVHYAADIHYSSSK